MLRKWIRKARPKMFENSKVPVFLSRFAPITIGAISLGPFVFSRYLMSDVTKRHETIHYHQQLELLFIFHYILYGCFYLYNKVVKKMDGALAYRMNPFEVEAYSHEMDEDYLEKRPAYAWIKYIGAKVK